METVNPTWLNLDFITKILKNDKTVISVVNNLHYKCDRAVNNGENYSSELFRLCVSCNDKTSTFKKSYIVKQMLDPKSKVGEQLLTLNIFEKELTMYSETLVAIGKVLESVGYSSTIGPRLVYWCKEPTVSLLVMEDLLDAGFSPPDRRRGLDNKHCEMVLTKLAQLHAASIFLNKKNAEYRTIYNKGGFFENLPDFLRNYYVNGINQAVEVMRNLPECMIYVTGFERYAEDMVQRGIELLRPIPPGVEDLNVLCHGDLWLNNILFKYDTQGIPDQVIFVDFQMSTFGNPGLDINYFFFTSPTSETRKMYRDRMLQNYVDVLKDILTKLQYDGLVPSIDDVNRKLLEAKDIAIMTPCIVLPLVKLNQEYSQTITTESLLNSSESETGSGLYNNKVYHKALCEAVQHLEELGYITESHV